MEPTKEQIEAAAKAMANHYAGTMFWDSPAKCSDHEKGLWRGRAIAAAPLLQMPWDPPTDKECEEIYRWAAENNLFRVPAVINRFLGRRNAALLPKPEDPRREKVIRTLEGVTGWPIDFYNVADRILAALDEKQ